jgi:hypothetical protein
MSIEAIEPVIKKNHLEEGNEETQVQISRHLNLTAFLISIKS